MRKKIEVFLSRSELEALDEYTTVRTKEQYDEDAKSGVPPSRRCRGYSRSRAARELMIQQLEWQGFSIKKEDDEN